MAHPNNVRDFFETGVTQNTNIALSASNSKGSVRLSYTNLYSKGAIPNVDLKRNTFSLNTTYDFTDRFHAKHRPHTLAQAAPTVRAWATVLRTPCISSLGAHAT